MSITITIPELQLPVGPQRASDLGRVGRALGPLLGPAVLHVAEDLIPGLGIAVAVAGLLRAQITL